MKSNLISFVTVTYNSAQFIPKLLTSIEKYVKEKHEIVVLDNNSSDKTLQIIKDLKIKVKILPQTQNLGFAKGNNLAVKSASGELIFFLNPDTELTQDIASLIEQVESDPQIGVIAPKLLLADGSVQPSVRKFPTLVRALNQYYFKKEREYEAYSPSIQSPTEVETVVGGAMLIKRSVFDQIGGFDERYFMYFEDLELCRQLKKLNYKIIYDPRVSIKHQVGQSAKTNPLSNKFLINSSKIYHGIFNAQLLYFIIRSSQLMKKLL